MVVGSAFGGVTTLMSAYDQYRTSGTRRVSPHAIAAMLPNSPAAAVAIELGATGGTYAPSSACASGAEALAIGLALIRSGVVDIVVAGAAEAPIHPTPMAAFAAARALSSSTAAPAEIFRPFDRDRMGFVMSEGAAVLILESEPHASHHSARVYCRLSGSGSASDAYHPTRPDPNGAAAIRAMAHAVADAGCVITDIDHVNVQASSTTVGDHTEACALLRLFGSADAMPAVTANKGALGHLLGASGAVESVFTVLAIADRVVPATLNLTRPDGPALPVVVGAPAVRRTFHWPR